MQVYYKNGDYKQFSFVNIKAINRILFLYDKDKKTIGSIDASEINIIVMKYKNHHIPIGKYKKKNRVMKYEEIKNAESNRNIQN